MKNSSDNAGASMFSANRESGINRRIFRTMIFATAVSVVASLTFAQPRITTGLLLGGVLSLFNHHWLQTSTTAAFSVIVEGAKPRLKLAHYILRYLVIAAIVFLAYKLDVVSLVATIAGLCTFVIALFVEAFRELYFAIIHREGIS